MIKIEDFVKNHEKLIGREVREDERKHLERCVLMLNTAEKLEAYKYLCKLAGVPTLLIEHPELLTPQKATQSDIDWAQKELEKWQKRTVENLSPESEK